MYTISNTLTATGYTLHKLDHTDTWFELPNTPANVKSIAIDDVGMAWVTTLNGKIYNHEGKSDWIEQDGDADDISISKNNVIWYLNPYG